MIKSKREFRVVINIIKPCF